MISRADVETLYSKFALDWGDARALTAAQVDLLCSDLRVGTSYGNHAYELSDLRQAFSWLLRKKAGRQGLPSVERIVEAVMDAQERRVTEERRARSGPRSGRMEQPDGRHVLPPDDKGWPFAVRIWAGLIKRRMHDREQQTDWDDLSVAIRQAEQVADILMAAPAPHGCQPDGIEYAWSPSVTGPDSFSAILAVAASHVARERWAALHPPEPSQVRLPYSEGNDPFADDEDAV